MVTLPSSSRSTRFSAGARYCAAALVVAFVAACRGDRHASVFGGEISSWAPSNAASFAGVPSASVHTAIETRLKAARPTGIGDDSWRHVRGLYQTFGGSPLWLDDKGVTKERVRALANALAAADSDALRTDVYPIDALSKALDALRQTKTPAAEQLADADVLLTSTFAALGEDLLTGQVNPGSVSQSWFIKRQEENIDSTLARTLRDVALDRSIGLMRPQDAGYRDLQSELMHYRQLATRGEWPQVPKGRGIKPGEHDTIARLTALAARLRAEGFLDENAPPPAADSAGAPSGQAVYTPALAGAVAQFQSLHGINVDSILGPETVESLNKPVSYRLGQIAANLERFRWLPRTLGSRYIIVNVPAFQLQAFDGGKPVLQMKVIVGAEYENRATPTFSDSMEYVVFRPYWIVPDTIAAKEIYPKVDQDPTYLDRNDYEITSIDGKRRVRQKPGGKNALGLLKFIFPNDFNIYLHDTPQGELFQKDVRAFSHGCIRVEKPAELAQFVLGWPVDRVRSEMEQGPDDHRVNLPRKVPVYIVYFTAYVRDDRLYFGNDLYNRDGALVQAVAPAVEPNGASREKVAELRRAVAG
jgi:murein L,D-transpeptidase YcbB/YkuD